MNDPNCDQPRPGEGAGRPHPLPTIPSDGPVQGQSPTPRARVVAVPIGHIIGQYTITRILGEGGFGVVYLADQHEPVQRQVALKILKPGVASAEVLSRFDAERRALSLMDHPGVAKVLDAGATPDGQSYFVMEYVPGAPINDYCDRHSLSVDARLALFTDVCRAVQHAHQKGIIHRDLKPSNILVTTIDGQPAPKVIDFGIAKAAQGAIGEGLGTGAHHTELGRLIGTPEYMSPEQTGSQGVDVDTRSDVYSLGVVLYELLTGALPFETASLRQAGHEGIRKMLMEVDPPKPSTKLQTIGAQAPAPTTPARPSLQTEIATPTSLTPVEVAKARDTDPTSLRRRLRGDLDWIVMKALEKDRARRYDSPSALAQDIERHLQNQAVLAGPPSAAYRLRKFILRHRVGVAVAAGFTILIVASFIGMYILYQRAEDGRLEAERQQGIARQQETIAKKEAAKSRSVVDFVSTMFASVDPNIAQGREITIRDMLDAAAADAGKSLAAQPEVELAVRAILGRAYHQISRNHAGLIQFQRVLTLAEQTAGKDSPEAAQALHNLAAAYLNAADDAKAEAELQRALDIRLAKLGADSADTLATQSLLGFAKQRLGKMEEALTTYRAAAAAQERVLGPADRETLDTRASLADVLIQLGRLSEAQPIAEASLKRATDALGPTDTATMQAQSILADVYHGLGDATKGEALLRETFASRERILGPTDPSTLVSANLLAATLQDQKKYDEAESLRRTVADRAKTALGPEHPATLTYIGNLGNLLRERAKYADAEPLLREVLAVRLRTEGEKTVSTLSVMNNLALLLGATKREAKALPLFERVLAGLKVVLPADHWMLPVSASNFGDCLRRLKRYTEAEPLLTAAYPEAVARLGPNHDHTRSIAEKLRDFYTDTGKPDLAAQWAAESKAAPFAPPPP